MLHQRIAPASHGVVVGVALHVEEEPVVELAGGAPGVPRLHPLELSAGQADPPQSVVLEVVADLHREDHSEAQRDIDRDRPCAAHPSDHAVPEGALGEVPPERIGVVPHGQVAAREPLALDPPRSGEVAGHLPWEVVPEALALGRGSDVSRGADQGVMNVDVLGDVVRIGDRRKQEFAEPTFPHRVPVNHLVAGDEHRLGHHGQHHRHQGDFPGGQVAGDEHLPEGEPQRHRPEHRPHPHRQDVPEQPVFEGAFRVQVPLVRAELRVEQARDSVERKREREPPAAANCGVDHEGKDCESEEVRERIREGRLDGSPQAAERAASLPTRVGQVLRHRDLPSSSRRLVSATDNFRRIAAFGKGSGSGRRTGWYSRTVSEATRGDAHAAVGENDSAWGSTPLRIPRIQGADAGCEVVASAARPIPACPANGSRSTAGSATGPRPEARDKTAFPALFLEVDCPCVVPALESGPTRHPPWQLVYPPFSARRSVLGQAPSAPVHRRSRQISSTTEARRADISERLHGRHAESVIHRVVGREVRGPASV